MGLLKPTSGEILVDGYNLHDIHAPDRIRSWTSSISHVPQLIFLADRSIAENIALGTPKDLIDMSKVRLCAKQAQISNYIESLPSSYSTQVGENGICLSGGQRQRIGIARGLYKNSHFLVMDEATSALDVTTEQSVLQSIRESSNDLTILFISHRITSLNGFDRIIQFDNGKIINDGHPNDIL